MGTGGVDTGCMGDYACCGVGGGEKLSLSCGICLFLANTAAWLLAQVASLYVFAHFNGASASCGNRASSSEAGCFGSDRVGSGSMAVNNRAGSGGKAR
jgi:hypothetical protein